MRFYDRILSLVALERKSVFLFGPRQTGKSSFLKRRFPDAVYYNLLLAQTFRRFSTSPELFRQEVLALKKEENLIIIDEIQKLPDLLDEVHALIEETDKRFILTGSSARKLKHGGANLLGGRAIEYHLFPLTSQELGPDFILNDYLAKGGIPSVYTSNDFREDLYSYVGTYLKEEIQSEGLVRRIEPFAQFLEKAALCNTELINFTKFANDVGVSAKTIKEYFQILEDTLVGQHLSPYQKTKKRKAVAAKKFYFFDLGVVNGLNEDFSVGPKSIRYGKLLEHFIFCELRAYLSYRRDRRKLSFWRSQSQNEVDFILGDDVAIEVKATQRVQPHDTRSLQMLSEEIDFKHKLIVSLDTKPRKLNGEILVLGVEEFLKRLWRDEF